MTHNYERVKTASDFAGVDNADADDTKGSIQDIQKDLKKLLRKLPAVARAYAAAAGPLSSPQLKVYADRITQRVKDLVQVGEALSRVQSLCKDLEEDVEKLCKKFGSEGEDEMSMELEGEIEDLSVYKTLLSLAEDTDEVVQRVTAEEDDGHIDWTLDDYLGGESGLYKRLQNANITNPFNDYDMSTVLYGALQWYKDPDYINDRLAEYLPEEAEDE